MTSPGPGHNTGIAADRLKAFVSRIERLNDEKKALGADIREVFAEAKSAGFDPKIMRLTIKERSLDKAAREERDALLEVYFAALGLDD